MERLLLTTQEAAALLDVHPATLAAWRSTARGPAFIKLGSKVGYDRQDIDAWLDRNRRTGTRR